MDSMGNTAEASASGASIDNDGNSASEDILHMCKFCDQSFPGLYQYNIHFVTKHLKDSLKSLNQTSKEKICRVISEEHHNNSSNNSPVSNFIVAQKELTGHINRNQVVNSIDTLYDKKCKREDYIAHVNAIQSIQQRHNISTYQFDAEIAENSNKPKVHAAYPSDTHNTSFSDHSDLKLQSNDQKCNQVSFERNSLITESLSNIMESYSKVIGEEVELEVKIRVRPIKDKNLQDNAVPHKYDIKQESLSSPSNSHSAASSHSSYDKSVFHQKDIGYHQRGNKEMTVKSYAFSHQLNIGSDCSVTQNFCPSSTERNVLNSKNGNDTSNKVLHEVSDNESDDIVIIEDPYLCKLCNSTFSQKSELSAHLCSNADRQNEELANEMSVRGIDRMNKNSKVSVIGEKGTTDVCKVEIQFSCKTCQRVFFDEDKFEAHYCDDINEMNVQSEHLTKNTPLNETINERRNEFIISEISSESNERKDRASSQNQCVVNEISIDDPDICIIEEPYPCGICKKVFSQKNELKMHSCTHNKQILAKKNSNQSLKHKKSNSSYGSGLKEHEVTASNISKNTGSLNNRLIIKVSTNTDICMRETHYSCNICEKHFSALNDLDNHACSQIKKHFSMEVDSNGKINVSLNLPKNVKDMSENHSDGTKVIYQYYCSGCCKGFVQQLDLYAHMKTCDYRINTKKKPLRILNSGKGTDSHCSKQKTSVIISNAKEDFAVGNSESDSNIVKNQFTHMCDKCHEGFFDKSNLDFHMHTHIENENLFCIFCKKKFSFYSKLLEHFNRHKDKKLQFCFHCSKGFIRAKELKAHLKTHKSRETHICDICKKCFDHKRSLKGHICQYASSENSSSKRKKGKEVCNLCNQTFYSKDKLKKHLYMHKRKDSLTCNICSLSFEHIRTLTGHLYRHANTRPYLCLICYSGCFAKRGFLKHLEKHTEEPSYICDICEESFAESCHLLNHMKIHKLSPKKRRKDSLADSF